MDRPAHDAAQVNARAGVTSSRAVLDVDADLTALAGEVIRADRITCLENDWVNETRASARCVVRLYWSQLLKPGWSHNLAD